MNPFRILKNLLLLNDFFDRTQQQIQQLQQFVGLSQQNLISLTLRERNFLSTLLDSEFHSFTEIAQSMRINESTARMYYLQLRKKNFVFKTTRVGKKLLLGLPQQKTQQILNRN